MKCFCFYTIFFTQSVLCQE